MRLNDLAPGKGAKKKASARVAAILLVRVRPVDVVLKARSRAPVATTR